MGFKNQYPLSGVVVIAYEGVSRSWSTPFYSCRSLEKIINELPDSSRIKLEQRREGQLYVYVQMAIVDM